MTEKSKMLAGDLYRASDPVLAAERLRAREMVHRFNAMGPAEDKTALAILRGLFGEYGEGTVVMGPFHCDYGYNIRIGRNGFLNYGCVFLDCAPITIGADAQIAPGVHIYTATHPLDPATRRTGLELARPVTIGDNVWLGGGAIVTPGVTIGDGTVVGAGSVVTRSLPAGVVAAGNPARIIREA